MRLVLHVGMGKTGTSTLQLTLSRHARLLANEGILYPSPPRLAGARFRQTNHNLLVARLRPDGPLPRELRSDRQHRALGDRRRKRFWGHIERQLHDTSATTVVLSGEYLFQLAHEEVTLLHQLLAPHFDEMVVAVYVREPASYYVSRMQQRVRASHDIASPANFAYSVRRSLENYVRVFGNVVVRAYERPALEGGCVVRDFSTHFLPHGPALADRLRVRDVNTSLSGEAMCVMQSLRRYGWPDDNDRFNAESARVARALQATRDESPQKPPTLRPPIAAALRSRFDDERRWLERETGVRFEAWQPGEPAAARTGELAPGWCSSDLTEVLDVDTEDIAATTHLALKALAGRRPTLWSRAAAALRSAAG